jgi:endonuclease/exonuclease/phosphatase family metal-dependent hydrolase
MSYNILKGGEDRLPLIRDVIRAQAADLVALQEASNHGHFQALADALDMEYVYGEADTRYSVAWLSRMPIVRSPNHRHSDLRKTLLEIEVEWQGAPLRLYAAHLRPRVDGEELRVREVEAILEVLHEADSQPHLLVGDMNTLHPDESYAPDPAHPAEIAERIRRAYDAPRLAIARLLAAGYIDCYRALHPARPGYTFATRLPMARIDYIFAPVAMAARLRACEVADGPDAKPASDHFPVWAEFA